MGDDRKPLRVGEAQERLGVSDTAVRHYIERDWLRAWWTGGGHARIDPESVDELLLLMRTPPGPERMAALEALAEANRARRSGGKDGPGVPAG